MLITVRDKTHLPMELNSIKELSLVDSNILGECVLYAYNITSDKCYVLKSDKGLTYLDHETFEIYISNERQ